MNIWKYPITANRRGKSGKNNILFSWAPKWLQTVTVCVSQAVMSKSLWSHGLPPTRLLCPCDFPARILEWVSTSSYRGSSQPRDQTHVSWIAGGFFTVWVTREALQMVTTVVKIEDSPWKKSYDKSGQCIKKQRHHFTAKICIVKAMASPVVLYGCDSWTIKKAEWFRTDAFQLWY